MIEGIMNTIDIFLRGVKSAFEKRTNELQVSILCIDYIPLTIKGT